jgi:hypothetical protein
MASLRPGVLALDASILGGMGCPVPVAGAART